MGTNTALKFVFAGDVMLGGEFFGYAQKHNMDLLAPFQLVVPNLTDADIIFVNLEDPIFKGSNKRSDVTTILYNHSSILQLFNGKNVCVVNLANNHIMDYGSEGLNHTLKSLESNGIYYVGAGNNSKEANQELIIEHKRKRIAFLAFTSNESHVGSIIAGQGKAGCGSFLETTEVIKRIQNIKNEVDIICISLHWGHEYYLYPSPEQVKVVHLLADAGATYIIGHHPHVVQSIKEYNGSLIIYSLGNFFFPPVRTISGRLQYQKKITREFVLVKSEIDESLKLSFDIIAGKLRKDYTLIPFDNAGQRKFISKIEKLSKPLSSPYYGQFWNAYKIKRERELRKESLIEAFKKLSMISFKQLIKTITIDDIKRNVIRFVEIFIKMQIKL